ncbi:MAG: sugar transferase [Propionibacteriaceae bacterium]|nr:sugar transferase [Propionibacteriaceae bacterium]
MSAQASRPARPSSSPRQLRIGGRAPRLEETTRWRAPVRLWRVIPLLLLGLDALLLTGCSWLALYARANWNVFAEAPDVEALVQPASVVIIGLWLLALVTFGTYEVGQLGTGMIEYRRVMAASVFVWALVAQLAFLAHYPISRAYYLMLFALAVPVLLVGRFLARRLVHRVRARGHLLSDMVIAGDPAAVRDIARVMQRERWLGYRVSGVVTTDATPISDPPLPVIGPVSDLVDLVKQHRPDYLLLTTGSFPASEDFRQTAWQFEDTTVQLIVVPNLTDVAAARLDVRPLAGLPLMYVHPPTTRYAARWRKRLIDIVGASLAILLTAPVMAITALAIKLEERGPVLFRQIRVGRGGRVFFCYKFRSMVVDAEARLAELKDQNETDGVLFKMAADPRVTRVGRIIRRFSIDELPQLFNVLSGSMSLIGPRPALPSEVARYDAAVRRRLHVRPGLTGLAQVSGRSDLSWSETVRLDLYYVDNWSLFQDLTILIRTVGAVLFSRGAY